MRQLLLTGSHIYGQPTDQSDYDVVLLVSHEELVFLADAAGVDLTAPPSKEWGVYDDSPNQVALTFGRLNLIVLTNPAEFEGWVRGTLQCLDLITQKYKRGDGAIDPFGPALRVSRDEAKAIMLRAVTESLAAALILPDYQI